MAHGAKKKDFEDVNWRLPFGLGVYEEAGTGGVVLENIGQADRDGLPRGQRKVYPSLEAVKEDYNL